MDNNFDTIVAIITPVALGAVGIIRISGDKSFEIAQEIFSKNIKPKRINYGYIKDENKVIDEVILLPFKAPHSYTAEDVIEIQSHGSPVILNIILELILSKGARIAQRGEFTKRAFLNHRIDLSQAEAVMDVITSKSSKSATDSVSNLGGYLKNKILSIKANLVDLYSKIIASVDFPEDVAEINPKYIQSICNDNMNMIDEILSNSKAHNYIKDGISACLIGKPNVGKSSLFNALLNYNRAIVTDIEGTTRDTINETLELDGYLINFIDTAGIRDKNKADEIEKIGIENSIESIKNSEIVIFLFEDDISEISDDLLKLSDNKIRFFVHTKADIAMLDENKYINTSSKTGYGIDKLKQRLVECIKQIIPDDVGYTTNKRHQACLISSKNYLSKVLETINNDFDFDSSDLCAMDLKSAILALDEITGEVLSDEILNNIFSNFCIGK